MRKLFTAIFLSLIFSLSEDIYAQSGENQWKLTATISEDSIAFAQFLFADPLHGYLLGHTLFGILNPPSYKNWILYRTIDGGSSWQKVDFHSILGSDTLIYDGANIDIPPYFRMFAASPNTVMFGNEQSGDRKSVV